MPQHWYFSSYNLNLSEPLKLTTPILKWSIPQTEKIRGEGAWFRTPRDPIFWSYDALEMQFCRIYLSIGATRDNNNCKTKKKRTFLHGCPLHLTVWLQSTSDYFPLPRLQPNYRTCVTVLFPKLNKLRGCSSSLRFWIFKLAAGFARLSSYRCLSITDKGWHLSDRVSAWR